MKTFHVSDTERFEMSSTSKGNQLKWNIDNMIVKANTFGYEDIAECLASEFLKYVEGIDFIDYHMATIVETRTNSGSGNYNVKYNGCFSYNILNNGEYLISFARLLNNLDSDFDVVKKTYTGVNLFNYVCAKIEDITGVFVKDYLGVLFKIDALIWNEDRHLNNIALITDDVNYRTAPIFDNGLSFLSDTESYPFGRSNYTVKAKPFNKDFIKQCSYYNPSPLVIDIDTFTQVIENKVIVGREKEFNRAVHVLFRNLKNTEGLIWIKK